MARPVTKRNIIEKTAITLFNKKGIASTTTKNIADHADVGEGTLYRYYKSKNEMAWQLFISELERFSPGLSKSLKNGGIKKRIHDSVLYFYRYFEKYKEEFCFILFSQHEFSEDNIPVEIDPYGIIKAFIEDIIDKKIIGRCDSAVLAANILGIILSPLILVRAGKIRRSALDFSDEIIHNIYSVLMNI